MNISEVIIENRMRKDLGDIDALAKSVEENGLINPITLTHKGNNLYLLIAGHRRLEALRKLGVTELEHAVHYLFREELQDDEYRRTAIELEENLRRKNMTWSEEIVGKQRLLETYQKIYGAPVPGQPSKVVQQGLKPAGFGVRKLAELLNENAGTTSQDLQMAALIQQFPILKNEPNKEAARRKLELALKIHAGGAVPRVAAPLIYKILITCVSETQQIALLTQLRGAGIKCQPIVA